MEILRRQIKETFSERKSLLVALVGNSWNQIVADLRQWALFGRELKDLVKATA
jgi:hypothetical protein